MPAGPMLLYSAAVDALLRAQIPLHATPITALLLAPGYVPDLALHTAYSDIAAYDLAPSRRVSVTGTSVSAGAFRSDTLMFGDPLSTGPVRHCALVQAPATLFRPDSPLIGVIDLAPDGPPLEARNGPFTVTMPAGGWFQLASL